MGFEQDLGIRVGIRPNPQHQQGDHQHQGHRSASPSLAGSRDERVRCRRWLTQVPNRRASLQQYGYLTNLDGSSNPNCRVATEKNHHATTDKETEMHLLEA
jgi:hypothetical protein